MFSPLYSCMRVYSFSFLYFCLPLQPQSHTSKPCMQSLSIFVSSCSRDSCVLCLHFHAFTVSFPTLTQTRRVYVSHFPPLFKTSRAFITYTSNAIYFGLTVAGILLYIIYLYIYLFSMKALRKIQFRIYFPL